MQTMIQKRNRIALTFALPFLIVLLVAASCRNNPNLTPSQNRELNLYASLDVITSANKSVATQIVALNQAKTVSDAVTRSVLDYSQKVNDSSRAALAVLDSSQSPATKAQAVLDTMKKLDLPGPVADFVNSNPSASAAISTVKAIVSIQQMIAEIKATPASLLGTQKQEVKP